VLLSNGDSFPHLIQKRRSQLGFVIYLLNYPRKIKGTNAAVSLEFLKSVSRILGPVLQFVTKRWIWALNCARDVGMYHSF
jgi:hypothetical protein